MNTFRIGFLASTLLSAASVSWAQTGMQPKHISRLQAVTSVEVSPDGKQFAYTLSVPRQPLVDKDGSAWSHLYVVDSEGNSRPFITGKESIGAPNWSPDGQHLFYLAKRGEDKQTCLYRLPINGGESVRVLEHDTSIVDFELHTDGQQIAYLATEKESKSVKEMKENGFNQEVFEEDWHPVRVWIAQLPSSRVIPNAQATVAGENDGNESGGSADHPRMLDVVGSASQIAWSSSGKELAVVLAPTPSIDDHYMAKQVYLVDSITGRTVQKIDHSSKLGDVAWSPDDKHIAMIAGANINDPQDGRLMIAATAGDSKPRDLMPDYKAHITSFAWRDKSSLVWTADEGTLTRVGSVTLTGQVTTHVEPSADQILSSLSLAEDGSVAGLLGHARTHFLEVFQLPLESNLPQRLTNSNLWLSDITFAKQETVHWTAEDGLELEGVLIYPLNYVQGRRYPMIMLVHGGPEAHESDGWLSAYSKPGQVGAARGFFVFYPNYRGSTGRGVEFSKLGQADAAGKEFSDLIDGIDALIAQGLVDANKVGITGGSYGGYASAWGATFYSERFAASVMFVGISNNISKVGTTDIPEEMFLVHHRKRLWDDWDYFLNSSPIRYVERNQTPTLILHGKDDPRVHPSQSLELHRHLKTLGQAPVRLVLYEGEGHGNRKAAARLDYQLRLLRWMEHYLMGPGGEAPPLELDYRAALELNPGPNSTAGQGN